LITLLFLSPFLWALAFRTKHREAFANIWKKPSQRGPLMALMISRLALAIFYIGFFLDFMFSTLVAFISVLLVITILLLLRRRIKSFYSKIEVRFLNNFNQREKEQASNPMPLINPWDSHIASFELNPYLSFIGKTLEASQLRETFGINVASIKRGDLIINVPKRSEMLYPNDILSIIGTDEQLTIFRDFIEQTKTAKEPTVDNVHEVTLHHFTLSETSNLIGRSIRETSIRELTHGLVVGIERDGKRILNPESNLIFMSGDTIWLAGDELRIQVIMKEQV
jgi:CPA2 family monovalent cation:H+ antiporter-2